MQRRPISEAPPDCAQAVRLLENNPLGAYKRLEILTVYWDREQERLRDIKDPDPAASAGGCDIPRTLSWAETSPIHRQTGIKHSTLATRNTEGEIPTPCNVG